MKPPVKPAPRFGQLPLTGELSDTVRASRVPSLAVLPIAVRHCPVFTSLRRAVAVTEYVVLLDVATVVEVVRPNDEVTTKLALLTDFTVPITPMPVAKPPGKPPARPKFRVKLPGLGDPVGTGAVPVDGPPSPPKPPGAPPLLERLNVGDGHLVVLVIVTVRAVTDFGAVNVAPGEAVGAAVGRAVGWAPVLRLVTRTQSPTATADRVVVDVIENVVTVPNATFFAPFDVFTVAPALPTPVTLPAAAAKFWNDGWPFVADSGPLPTVDWLLPELPLPPQPATSPPMTTHPMRPVTALGRSVLCSRVISTPLIGVTRFEVRRSEQAAQRGLRGTRQS